MLGNCGWKETQTSQVEAHKREVFFLLVREEERGPISRNSRHPHLLVLSRVLCTSLFLLLLLLLCFFFVVFLTWSSWRRRPSLRTSIASLKEVVAPVAMVATMTELSHTPTQRFSPSMPPPSRMLEYRMVPPSTPSRARLNSTVVRRSLAPTLLQLGFSCLFLLHLWLLHGIVVVVWNFVLCCFSVPW